MKGHADPACTGTPPSICARRSMPGTTSDEYFTLKPDAEMAIDRRLDDAGSLTFQTAPLSADHDVSQPVRHYPLRCAAMPKRPIFAPGLSICTQIGTATRISFGVLNACPSRGHYRAKPLKKRQSALRLRLMLDACGYRFLARGHRIGLSLSTAYWPMILPPPENQGLTIDIASIGLALPKTWCSRSHRYQAAGRPLTRCRNIWSMPPRRRSVRSCVILPPIGRIIRNP